MRLYAPRVMSVALASGTLLALGACGSSKSSSSSTSSSATAAAATTTTAAPTGAASTVKLSADPSGALKFTTTKLTAKAGTVTVAMKNPSGSGVPHAIAIEGNGVDQDGKTVQPGGTSTDTLKLKPGTYDFYCPVPGHKAAGMTGTLVVTG
ncbi:MAG: hypothetical protein JWO02_824 [Solirubrobacterales bacterium]|nr:hypothetical protein [Solirubrobacterales bacterium]